MNVQEFAEKVRNTPHLRDFSACIASTLDHLGFQRHAYVAFMARSEPHILDNYPSAYREHFIENDYVYIDPVLMGTKRSLLPFKWSKESRVFCEKLPLSPKQRRILEEGSEFGINRGIAIPIHLVQGSFGVLVANSDVPAPELDKLWQDKALELQLYALHIHEAYQEIASLPTDDFEAPLSPRERECLQLLAAGKDLWSVSEILSLSLDTVRNYLRSARRKLRVTNTMHAVVKAMHNGLIGY